MRTADDVIAALRKAGLILTQDKVLPSVVSIVTGETPRGSWWSHPKGRQVFAVLTRLADDEDVMLTKLLDGKDTFVHRRLWPALAAVGSARETWQLKGLSPTARRVLLQVDGSRSAVRATGPAAKTLLRHLLVAGREVHTESGAHATALESWSTWSKRAGCRPLASAVVGRRRLEETVKALGGSPSLLPWTVAATAT